MKAMDVFETLEFTSISTWLEDREQFQVWAVVRMQWVIVVFMMISGTYALEIIRPPKLNRCLSTTCEIQNKRLEHMRQCHCDKDCHLFGECCLEIVDLDKSTQETMIRDTPRHMFSCEDFKVHVPLKTSFPKVHMVTKCPSESSDLMKCEGEGDYIQDVPVLSTDNGIWYRNVYCAACHGKSRYIAPLFFTMNTSMRKVNEHEMKLLLKNSTYIPRTLSWIVDTGVTFNLSVALDQNVSSGVLRSCAKQEGYNLLEIIDSCPLDWPDKKVATLCQSYATYVRRVKEKLDYEVHVKRDALENSTLLSQVYKNLHCAQCHGVPISDLICWNFSGPDVRHLPTLALVMDFNGDWSQEEQIFCKPPNGVWDILHEKCMPLVTYEYENEANGENSNNSPCTTLELYNFEYKILINGSLQYLGSNERYNGYIFHKYKLLENGKALVCSPEENDKTPLLSVIIQGYLSGISMSVSIVCLILHISIYYMAPKMHNLPGKNLLALSCALLLAQLVFLLGAYPVIKVSMGVCIGIAALNHFCFLAAFCWMNIMSIDIWRTFSMSVTGRRTGSGHGGQKTHYKYAVYAWGLPALIVASALATDFIGDKDVVIRPAFGLRQLCWFGNKTGLAVFLAVPVFLLLLINSALFTSTVFKICQAQAQGEHYLRDKAKSELLQTKSTGSSKENHRSISRKDQHRFYLYLKLCTIMGLTWIFGIVATLMHITWLWYPFVVLNGLQGAFIFVMFDLKRNVATMIWERLFSPRGYELPRFLLTRTSTSTTMTGSSRVNGSSSGRTRHRPVGGTCSSSTQLSNDTT